VRGWLILSVTLVTGFVLGIGAATKGPAVVAPYLPSKVGGAHERIEGQVVRKQRDGNRLLVKVATAQGPMLVAFTQKVGDLDVLLDSGDTITLVTAGYATFVDDPGLDRVKAPTTARVPSPPPSGTASGPTH
jgi:hypothetical protein